jgi:NADPH:quinone reductase-like Zn-dependent oxidoreductase
MPVGGGTAVREAGMKAIVQDRYGSVDELELRDIDQPTAGDGEVLVKVRAAGVDPGVWHLMTGRPYLVRLMGFGLRTPRASVRGSDLAGVIEAVGRGVSRFRLGEEVYGTCDGSFAEYARTKAERLSPKPSNLSFEQAAAVPVSGMTALSGVRDSGKVQPGQQVLVIGAAGGVGTFAVQVAKAFEAVITGVCSTSKLDLVRSIGADEVIDYTRTDFLDGSRRFDLILDTAGRRPVSHLRRALAPSGVLVIVGGEGGGRWLGGFQRQMLAPMRSVASKQRLLGLMYRERPELLMALTQLIEAGTVRPVIDRSYPLAEAADAIRYLE